MKPAMSHQAARFLFRSQAPIATRRQWTSEGNRRWQTRGFCGTRRLRDVKPYLLADIGEGITECQVIQWFVKPGARVEQFDPICEVQSDKASVEITSRFDGVIKKLYYEQDDMAKVGKPLVDIDIQSEISPADEALLKDGPETKAVNEEPREAEPVEVGLEIGRNDTNAATGDIPPPPSHPLPPVPSTEDSKLDRTPEQVPGKHASLATPAVRHRIQEMKLKIEDIEGTGREGRVLKEDIQRHVDSSKNSSIAPAAPSTSASPTVQPIEDHVRTLTPVQAGMYKQMTRSLSIPHFLYTDNVDFTSLTALRKRFNTQKERLHRITPLPFIVKAVSLALQQFPLLNAHLDTTTDPNKPRMLVKGSHNIGVAVDTPSGLLVPVIRDVQSHSIESLAAEITRIGNLARTGKLTSADLTGATFTVSNVGNIGGAAVAPVIVSPQVGILGIGRARIVPAFGADGELIRKEECVFSWSADHRVIDGAMAARCAEAVRVYLENMENMLVRLR